MKKLYPINDQGNPKYRDDSSRVWFSGQWRTLESVEKKKKAQSQANASGKWNEYERRRRLEPARQAKLIHYDIRYRLRRAGIEPLPTTEGDS